MDVCYYSEVGVTEYRLQQCGELMTAVTTRVHHYTERTQEGLNKPQLCHKWSQETLSVRGTTRISVTDAQIVPVWAAEAME